MAKVEKSSKEDSKKGKSGGGLVREQIPPIYKVVSGGVTVDFTDKPAEANTVFREAYAVPKFIYTVNGRDVQCIAAQYR